MGFRRDMSAVFGTAPEGEEDRIGRDQCERQDLYRPSHGQAIVRAEEGEGMPLGDMTLGPIPDGFVTDAGRYVSRREAADIAARTSQGQTRGRWGATRGLASEDVTPASGPSHPTRVQTAATAPGIPGGSGVWGVLGPRGAEGTAPLQPGETVLWHRAQRPGKLDARNLQDYEIQSSLQNAWEQGHDAVTITNYTRPHGTKPETILVVRDPNQLRSPAAAFNPAKRNSANLLASLLGTGVLGPSLSSAISDPTSLPIPQPKPPVF